MSDWINQFTSSYVSSIAYGLTALILSLLFKPVSSLFSNWVKQFTEVRKMKQNNSLVLPTQQETARFSAKQVVTENEWKEAIEFLKHDIEPLTKYYNKPHIPGEQIDLHFDKHRRIYQYTLVGLALANFFFALLKARLLQTIILSIFAAIFLWIILAISTSFLLLIVYVRKEKSNIKKIKSQIHDAINVIVPNVAFTYGELGELVKNTNETDLIKIQSELSDIGISFNLEDLRLAQLLSTAPAEKLLLVGKKLLSSLEQFNELPNEKKDEFAQIIVESIRLYPVQINKSE